MKKKIIVIASPLVLALLVWAAIQVTKSITVVVSPAPVAMDISACPTTAQVSVAYTCTAVVTGGTPPYTCSLSAGTLPPGLTLSTVTNGCRISGTPTQAGTFTASVTAADSTPVSP